MQDQNFDGRAERFQRKIYGSPKGRLRLALLKRELEAHLPLAGATYSVWDAGGGLGQMSAYFAELGHQVLLSDISQDMLDLAQVQLPTTVKTRCASIQDLAAESQSQGAYDVVVCHAVLEWLAEPERVLQQLLHTVRPGGYLSLMFYNLNALVLGNMVKGNFNKLARGEFRGDAGSFTPLNPQRPHEVLEQLQRAGFEILSKRAIRLAQDLLRRELQAERSWEDLLALEWQYGADEPFWQLGRYVHLLARRPSQG